MTEHQADTKEGKDGEEGLYELGYLLSSLIPEENTGEEVSKIKDILESEGMIIASEEPKLKTLQYEMRHVVGNKNMRFSSAYFGSVIFQTTRARQRTIKERLEKNNSIIRMLIIARTKKSLIAPERKMPSRVKPRAEERAGASKEIPAPINEAELEKAIEKMTAA